MRLIEQSSNLGCLSINTLQPMAGFSKGFASSPVLACGTPLLAPLPQALYPDRARSGGPAGPKVGMGFPVETLTPWAVVAPNAGSAKPTSWAALHSTDVSGCPRPLGIALVCTGAPEDGDQAAADQAEQFTAMPRNNVARLPRKIAQHGGDTLRRGDLACLLPGADIGEEDGDDSVGLL